MARLTDELRRAIESSGVSRYRIAKESGVSAGQLSRLVNGKRGLSVDCIERVADALGYRVTLEPKRRRKGR